MNYFVLAVVLLDSFALCLEQFTPDRADWSTFQQKAMTTNTDHSPDGISWITRDEWLEWDGTIYDPTKYSKSEFAGLICTGNTIRGLRSLFYQHDPFANVKNPTKAEVDEWHRLSLNHVRSMVGYSAAEYQIQPDKCLHLRALWSRERHRTRMWDTDKYPGTCEGSTNPHCGASFIPSVEDQQPYLPDGISSCKKTAGSEGMFNAAKSNIPWSIKWIRPFCSTLRTEGFWGGHTGPWFHRSLFGWDWYDADPENHGSNAALRAKWSGPKGVQLYENPDITSGRFLVESAEPRFPGYECKNIIWGEAEDDATKCYERMLSDDNCGKRFMTYNSNGGCACYAPDMAICDPKMVSGRRTWDFEPIASSFGGFFLPDNMLHNGKRCQDIIWLTSAGDASHCLEKVIASLNDPNSEKCGTKYITFNANGGGCACYPPEQTTCATTRESGRQTFELQMDPSYDPDIDGVGDSSAGIYDGACASMVFTTVLVMIFALCY